MVKKSHKAKSTKQGDAGTGGATPRFAMHQNSLPASPPVVPLQATETATDSHMEHPAESPPAGELSHKAETPGSQRVRRFVVIESTEPLLGAKQKSPAEAQSRNQLIQNSKSQAREASSQGKPATRGSPSTQSIGRNGRAAHLRYAFSQCESNRIQPHGSAGLASLCLPDTRKAYLAGLERALSSPGGETQAAATQRSLTRSLDTPGNPTSHATGSTKAQHLRHSKERPTESSEEETPREVTTIHQDANLGTPEKLAGPPFHSRDSSAFLNNQTDDQPSTDVRHWVSAVLDRIWDSQWNEKPPANCFDMKGIGTSTSSAVKTGPAENPQCSISVEGNRSAGPGTPPDCDFGPYGISSMADEQSLNKKSQRPVDFGSSVVVFTGSGLRVLPARDVVQETSSPGWPRLEPRGELPPRVDLSGGGRELQRCGPYPQRSIPQSAGVGRLESLRGMADAREKALCVDRPVLHYFPSYDGFGYLQGLPAACPQLAQMPPIPDFGVETGAEAQPAGEQRQCHEMDPRAMKGSFVPRTFGTGYVAQNMQSSRPAWTERGGGPGWLPPTGMRAVGGLNPSAMPAVCVANAAGPPRGRLLQRPTDVHLEASGAALPRHARNEQGLFAPNRSDSTRRFSGPAGILPEGYVPHYPAEFPMQFHQFPYNQNMAATELLSPTGLFRLNPGMPSLNQSSQLRRRISNTVKGPLNRQSSSGEFPAQDGAAFRKSLSDVSQVKLSALPGGVPDPPLQPAKAGGPRRVSLVRSSGGPAGAARPSALVAVPYGGGALEAAHAPPVPATQSGVAGPPEGHFAREALGTVPAAGIGASAEPTSPSSLRDSFFGFPHGPGEGAGSNCRPADPPLSAKAAMLRPRGPVAATVSLLSSRIRRQWKEKNDRHPWWDRSKPPQSEEPSVDGAPCWGDSKGQSSDPRVAAGDFQPRVLGSSVDSSRISPESATVKGVDGVGLLSSQVNKVPADGPVPLISRSYPPGGEGAANQSKHTPRGSKANPLQSIFASSSSPSCFPLWPSIGGAQQTPQVSDATQAATDCQGDQKKRVLAQPDGSARQEETAAVWEGRATNSANIPSSPSRKATPVPPGMEGHLWNIAGDSVSACPVCLLFYSSQRHQLGTKLVIPRLPLERGLLPAGLLDERDVRRLTMARLRCHSTRVKAALRRLRAKESSGDTG